MPEFTRVLCAVDLSDASRRALDCALWWARQHGADVSVLHVRQLALAPTDATRLEGDLIAPGPPPAPVDLPLTGAERAQRVLALETFVHERRTDGL
jgi:nucleotide-binding universal stress UspA family protein